MQFQRVTYLHIAAEVGQNDVAHFLLERVGFPYANAINACGHSALDIAALFGHTKICRLILNSARFLKFNHRNNAGRTALHHAAMGKNPPNAAEVCRVLLQDPRIDPNIQSKSGETALHDAACHGLVDVCKVLLEDFRFSLASTTNSQDLSALDVAAQAGHREICNLILKNEKFAEVNRCNYLAAEVCRVLLQEPRIEPNIEGVNGETALCDAVSRGLVDVCKVFLEFSSSDAISSQGHSALDVAAYIGHAEICKVILDSEHFSKVNHRNHMGRTALHHAVAGKNQLNAAEVCRVLLQDPRIDPNIEGVNGETALCDAVSRGLVDVCKVFLEFPSSGNTSLQGHSALDVAAYIGHAEICKVILDSEHFSKVNHRNHMGRTALHHAVAGKNQLNAAEVCRVLLQEPRIEPNIEGVNGETALCDAVSRGLVDVCKVFLEFSSSDAISSQGHSALDVAAYIGHAEICKVILDREHFSEVNHRNHMGRTALHHAVAGKNQLNAAEVCRVLLWDPRIDPNIRGKHGETALHDAAVQGHTEICKLILSSERFSGANDRDYLRCTALHLAVASKNSLYAAEVCRLLLQDPRVDPNIRGKNGETALHCAAGRGLAGICRVLLEDAGSLFVSAVDCEGHSALDIAAYCGHSEVCTLILHCEQFRRVNHCNHKGRAALHHAIAGANVLNVAEVCRVLLRDPRVDPNIKAANGKTALHDAACRGLVDVCKVLLEDDRLVFLPLLLDGFLFDIRYRSTIFQALRSHPCFIDCYDRASTDSVSVASSPERPSLPDEDEVAIDVEEKGSVESLSEPADSPLASVMHSKAHFALDFATRDNLAVTCKCIGERVQFSATNYCTSSEGAADKNILNDAEICHGPLQDALAVPKITGCNIELRADANSLNAAEACHVLLQKACTVPDIEDCSARTADVDSPMLAEVCRVLLHEAPAVPNIKELCSNTSLHDGASQNKKVWVV
eukprot:TRINITY_DN10744_c0_g1_i2.p1 TRINITY_DN10744_c0_g1~~TRINITY_DN10744_c0_g1_i2.p1  ORF type:complete len:1106 (-),score=159.58 TRINITY_DN10744_c0_g1_i2:260-3151(-)